EPGRRCGHVERSPMTAGTRASAPAGQRSRCPCCTIAEPSCRRCLVSKLDTMPQEGAFMERPFAFRTTSLHPPRCHPHIARKVAKSTEYDARTIAALSRAVHKIAFEALAESVFVSGSPQLPDLFDAAFNPVRRWAREGQPPNPVRP